MRRFSSSELLGMIRPQAGVGFLLTVDRQENFYFGTVAAVDPGSPGAASV